jgi:hypothetical protein
MSARNEGVLLGSKCHANGRIGRSDRSDVTEYMQYGTFETETQILQVRRPWSVFIKTHRIVPAFVSSLDQPEHTVASETPPVLSKPFISRKLKSRKLRARLVLSRLLKAKLSTA